LRAEAELDRLARCIGCAAIVSLAAGVPAACQLDGGEKTEDWQAIASLATTLQLHRWAIHTAASASDCEIGNLTMVVSPTDKRKLKL
jgi:hypothetical protein